MKKGDKLPAFTLPDQNGRKVNVNAGGKPKVIFFYPKDATPGCTLEAKAFNDALPKLKKVADVYGISSDDVASHKSFCTDLGLNYQLLVGADLDRRALAQTLSLALRSFARSLVRPFASPTKAAPSARRLESRLRCSERCPGGSARLELDRRRRSLARPASLTRAPRFARSPGYVVDKSGEVISVLDDQFKPEKHVSNAMSALGIN